MNLDELFHLQADSVLVSTNPFLLLGCVSAAVLSGWFCAAKYRNTYDIEKSIHLYLPFALAGMIAFTAVGLPLLFSIGAQLCGFAALLLISNHYFNQ